MDALMPNLADVGGWALFIAFVSLNVLGFIKGYIYPSAVVATMLAEATKALESEREISSGWKLAFEDSQKALAQRNQADMELLMRSVGLVTKTLSSFQEAAEISGGVEIAQGNE